MKERKGWIERLAEETELQGELFPGQPLVELFGDKRVLIEHHRGVTQYGTEEICVRLKYGFMHICGCNLELAKMNDQQLVVTGRIDSLGIVRGR